MKQPFGVILAGGQARRMGGGDKALLQLGGQTLLAHVAERLEPQVARLALNANGDPARFGPLDFDIVPDSVSGQSGPLAGVLAGLDWAAALGADHVVTVAADTPFFPCDLVPRLLLAAETEGQPIALARSPEGIHPTFGLWPVALREALRQALADGTRKLRAWAAEQGAAFADFPAQTPDAFFNINTPDDLAAARAHLAPADAATPLAADCFAEPEAQGLASVAEAQARLRASLHPVTGIETVGLAEAAGRILARDVTARRANPPATNSAMDGYAFAHASLSGTPLKLTQGRSAAGAPFAGTVAPGHALRIFTGALLPEGTDTVVMQENTTAEGGHLTLAATPAPRANTRPTGEDVAEGAPVLAATRRLGPREVGLLAAVGIAEVAVRQRLRVGVLSTGDELVAPDTDATPGQTFDANRPMLIGMAAGWGHAVTDLGHVPDDRAALRARLDEASAGLDAILTSGGASVGDEDHVSALLREAGQVAQWRVALKPGKPLLLGQWRRVPVFGLPGNPVSAFTTACLFVHPALSLMAGGAWSEPRGLTLPAGFTLSKRAGRRAFLRARMRADGTVETFRSDSSGMISGLAWADGFVELPEAACEIAPGDPVRYLPFTEFGLNP